MRGAGIVVVNENNEQDVFSFTINVKGKKSNDTIIWKPTKEEIVENVVIRKKTYSKQMFEAISGFWAIYND